MESSSPEMGDMCGIFQIGVFALFRLESPGFFQGSFEIETWGEGTRGYRSQVKDNKIDLLVQQYEQFTILEEESIDSGFARFNTIITSLKALDEGFSSKNYVRKFLKALDLKWREKVTSIEESKNLSSLALDELIDNLKVHEVVMEKDFEIYRGKKERVKSIALKARKESNDDETLKSGSDDEEYAMAVRNFKKFFRRKGKFARQPREEKKSFRQRDEKKGKSDQKCFRCGDPNHLIGDCPKPPHNKDQKAFIGENSSSLDNDSIQIEYDNLCEISLKIINKNKILKTKRDLLEKEILELNEKIKKLERNKGIDVICESCQELKLENAKLKETQIRFVKFDKSENSLKEMLSNQKSSSCKIGLGFDSSKASTSRTKPMSFIGSSTKNATDGSTIKVHGSTVPGSVNPSSAEKVTEHIISPPMSSRLDFVITRKKLIHNRIEESKKPSLKPSLRSGLGYVKTESRKQAHASHKAKNMVSTKRCLELLHMDLFGPSAIKSYGGNFYTLVVVDDYSRYTLKTKNEAFEKVEILNRKIQNQLGSSIVAIRTDHGQEFDNEVQFGAYCDAQGITHNFSAPRTPQSNGVVKRKNITLQEMSRTILHEQSIPQKFWCNVVDTSTYILNRILIRPILGKTPYEIFRVKESLNVTFDESPPPTKLSPLVDDDVGEEEAIKNYTKVVNNNNNEEDESIEVNEVVNIKESKNHPLDQAIGNFNQRTLRSQAQNHIPLPMSQSVIGTKWVFRNKLDENGIVSRNKARLVAQGYNQQEGIDYDETYAPVARLLSIRILLAIACANDFKLYQMDVKSDFLNGLIYEEVYIAQPLGFIDFEKPNYVYKLKKALYGLKQAPKACHIALVKYVNKKRHILFSTVQNLCDDFAKIMHDEFEMSMMGELNFFLGLQIKQMEDEIFFNQSKYIKEMLNKFGLEDSKPTKTSMSMEIKLTKDDEADFVDSTKYQGIIGSLLYLTESRPDIMFSVCLCAHFQENPKTTHLEAVKRIFRYIRGTIHLGLWYPKGTKVETIVYADSNHVGNYVDRKSTSSVCAFMGCCLTSWFAKKQTSLAISTTEAEYFSAGKACQQAL
ncbi:retrovirus-related pol polyprotein from transposon TNT 1-94 [Tanacetum coccineum]